MNIVLFFAGELIVLGAVIAAVCWMAQRQKQDAAEPGERETTEFSSQQDD